MKYDNSILYEPLIPYDHQRIKIKYKDGMPILRQNEKGGCIDLYNFNTIELKKGEYGFIDLGVAIELPQGYDALILPRSSTFKRYGILLTNSMGYIDNSYNGDNDWWMACVYATRDVQVPAGERCFQFRLIKTQPKLQLKTVSSLGNQDRGGFGSTNKGSD